MAGDCALFTSEGEEEDQGAERGRRRENERVASFAKRKSPVGGFLHFNFFLFLSVGENSLFCPPKVRGKPLFTPFRTQFLHSFILKEILSSKFEMWYSTNQNNKDAPLLKILSMHLNTSCPLC